MAGYGGGGGGWGGNMGGAQSHATFAGGGGGLPQDSPGARHVLITVPRGFSHERKLTFKSPGGHCSVQVPQGLQGGDSLQVALPHVEQKIAILNAYFGRDDEPYPPKSGGPGQLAGAYMKIASSVIDHATSELGIEAKLNVKHKDGRDRNLADKVDICLEHILETGQMLPNPELQSIACEEVQLSLCRNRSVATAVAVPIQPPSMRRRVEAVSFVGPPTSSHNGIYLSGPGLCGFVIHFITAVDDRTLELSGCGPCIFCFPFHVIYTTYDGIRYSTSRDGCGQPDWIEKMGACFCFESCALGYTCKVSSSKCTVKRALVAAALILVIFTLVLIMVELKLFYIFDEF